MATHRRNWNSDFQNRALDFLRENEKVFSEDATALFEGFIDDIDSEISDLNEEISTLNGKVDDRDGRIDELLEQITELEQKIENLESLD